jgi:hypothetical protein
LRKSSEFWIQLETHGSNLNVILSVAKKPAFP